jgi:hypothetical protein
VINQPGWLSKLAHYLPLPLDGNFMFNALYRENHDFKRRLISLLLDSTQSTIRHAERIAFFQGPMIPELDLPWLLEQLGRVTPLAKNKWVEVIKRHIYPDSVVKCWDVFLESVEANPELKASVGHLIGSWQLDETKSQTARADWLEERALAASVKKRKPAPLCSRLSIDLRSQRSASQEYKPARLRSSVLHAPPVL